MNWSDLPTWQKVAAVLCTVITIGMATYVFTWRRR